MIAAPLLTENIPTGASTVNPPVRFKGRLHLSFTTAQKHTILNVIQQTAPLKVIRAFEQDSGGVLVHLHNVSGGILGGDQLDYQIDLAADTRVQLTTTSATRIYRRREVMPPAVQTTAISVGENALLEIVPDQIIPFAGSAYRQDTSIELADSAGLFWWETVAPGRLSRGELFAYELLTLRTRITVGDRPIALEHVNLEPALRAMPSFIRLSDYRYFSTFYICKVGVSQSHWLNLESQLREMALAISNKGDTIWGVSTLAAHGLVIRGLSGNGRALAPNLLQFWQQAKQALYSQDATPPRKIY
jgi:urease accessory protein